MAGFGGLPEFWEALQGTAFRAVKGHLSHLIAGVIHSGLGDIEMQFILCQHTSQHRIIPTGAVGGMAAAMAARALGPAVAHVDPTSQEGVDVGEWAGHGENNKGFDDGNEAGESDALLRNGLLR